MKKYLLTCICLLALLAFGCETAKEEPLVSTDFDLTYCDTDNECSEKLGSGFSCDAVYCDMACKPDGSGGCLPCNNGKMGKCMPVPEDPCDQCGDNKVCVKKCLGVCDGSSMKCKDVSCKFECLPLSCSNDGDCGENQICEKFCVYGGCDPATGYCAGDANCTGVCVDKPKPPDKCNSDADCGEGFICGPVLCPMMCAPDYKGGCLPCNDGFLGQCVPAPSEGCKTDAECDDGDPNTVDKCAKYCMGLCAPEFCGDKCFGQCVHDAFGCKDDSECGKGFHCEKFCPATCPPCPDGKICPMAGGANSGEAMPCVIEDCYGQCVPNPEEPKKCNEDEDCPEGFVCEPVFCALMCAPDGKGGCLPCNGGFLGYCVPKPQEGCQSDADCDDNDPGTIDRCLIYCMGLCDASSGCGNEKCFGECIHEWGGCKDDSECGEGFICEKFCAPGCPPCPDGEICPMGAGSDSSMPCVIEDDCFGQCVPKPEEPKKCNADADCPEGFVCEIVFCTMACIPDSMGGCLPCNDGFLGQCVPKPAEGCSSDAECDDNDPNTIDICVKYCPFMCAPDACDEFCKGECVHEWGGCTDDSECGEGFYCEKFCAYSDPASFCGKDSFCEPECYGQCVPKKPEPGKCNEDKDCPDGFVCEPVYCAFACIPDRKGGCLPCNDGFLGQCVPKPTEGCSSDAECDDGNPQTIDKCQIYCMGVCDPNGSCGEEKCFGECVYDGFGCKEDKECGEGFFCEKYCPPTCPPCESDPCPMAPCYVEDCFGQCVPVKPEPVKCNDDGSCPEGFVCESVFCTEQCVPDGFGGCLPCNDGFLGICIPKPIDECGPDMKCAPDEICETYCMGLCDPSAGCSNVCKSVCVKKPDVCACPEYYSPVCGTDGKTYGNACEAKCAGVGVAYQGECK